MPLRNRSVALVALALFLVACAGPAADAERAGKVAFRDRVVAILAAEFPHRQFAEADDPELLMLGETQFGLQNLRAKFVAAGARDDELAALVVDHFRTTLAASMAAAGAMTMEWAAAKPLLRPQLVPAEYVERLPLAHRPFASGVLFGLVVDEPTTYRYVREEDLTRWGMTFDQASAVALDNLQEAAGATPVTRMPGANEVVAVATGDGYDAARLLLPAFRAAIVERLGSPFYAAVPNRDFLIMWPASAPPEFQLDMRNKVAEDFARRPYPLSGSIFQATAATVEELDR